MSLPVSQRFACAPRSASAARAFAVDAVAGLDVDVDAVELLVSELASNAVRHAHTDFELSVSEIADGVRVEVTDEAPSPLGPVRPADSGGFGLEIVESLARAWGVESGDQSKVVWFELPTPVDTGGGRSPPDSVEVAPRGSAQPIYSIGAVSRMVGVTASTLRAWERRYGTVVPTRSRGGQRLYSRDQIDQLRFATAHIEQGMAAADAHRLLAQRAQSVTFVPAAGETSTLILLAERDPYAADLAEYFLRTEGYGVRVAFDDEEARRLGQEEHLDLAIVDLLMPGGGASAVCRELSEARIPVLAVSSLNSRDAAMTAGASAFLLKPLDLLQLVSTVRDLLGTSALGAAAGERQPRDVAPR